MVLSREVHSMVTHRLISFDVGIKNLAYCIFEYDPSNASSLKVLEWNVLNLCPSAEPMVLCSEMLKTNKKACGKKTKYHKDGRYVCEKHAKQCAQNWMPSKDYTAAHLKKQKPEQIETLIQTHLPQSTATTKPTRIQELVAFYETKTWKMIPSAKRNASKTDLITIGREMYRQLRDNPLMPTLTHVIIENQISPIANRMKTVQGMLAQHFITIQIPFIDFVSSGNKLKQFEEKSEAKTAYQKHKKDAVFYCQEYLGKMENPEWLSFFSHFSEKKDDLADCFLQGVAWTNQNVFSSPRNSQPN
jgi:hypothetical protein